MTLSASKSTLLSVLVHSFCQCARCPISHQYGHFANPPTALQKTFETIAEQLALGSEQFLRHTHEGVYPLKVAV